ncbi:MAG: MBL fold metallo-hydrolase [Eubacterium sp.]|nr:MBL fold metallo-hydrolase [Eubacterium sp.]
MKKRTLAYAGILLLLIIGLVSLVVHGQNVHSPTENDSDLQVRILQTKDDADCIIINAGADAVMIDTGEAQDGEHIIQELQEAGIENLDALILTHPDKDHIGGALAILKEIPVEKVFHPYYDGEEEELTAVETYCKERKITVYYPNRVWEINTGYVKLWIYPPHEKHYKKDNNYSLAVLAQHGEVKMFFAGDAQRKRSEELMTMNLPEVALYKVAHHGRANSVSSKLFETLNPEFAVVTSDSADKEILESSEKCGSRLLFSREADLLFLSDGKQLSLYEGEEGRNSEAR